MAGEISFDVGFTVNTDEYHICIGNASDPSEYVMIDVANVDLLIQWVKLCRDHILSPVSDGVIKEGPEVT